MSNKAKTNNDESNMSVANDLPIEVQIELLRDEVREAATEVSRLESQLNGMPKVIDDLTAKRNAATIKRDAAMAKLERLQPRKLPPIPNFDAMFKRAKEMCPDRNLDELKVLVGRALSGVVGANAGHGYYEDPAEAAVTGTEVRDVQNTRYDLEGPPADAAPGRYIKSYG
jgi:hypothetical protein